MGVNKAKGRGALVAMAQEICIVGSFQVSAALADRASVNVPHHRDEALDFNTARTLDREEVLFRLGIRIFRRRDFSHFGCGLSVIPVTRHDRGGDGRHRKRAEGAEY